MTPGTHTISVNYAGDATYTAAAATPVTVVIGGPPPGLRFVPVTPCRIADTRNPAGPFGGPFITGGTSRGFAVPDSGCNIHDSPGLFRQRDGGAQRPTRILDDVPRGQSVPLASTLNSIDGRVKAAAAIEAHCHPRHRFSASESLSTSPGRCSSWPNLRRGRSLDSRSVWMAAPRWPWTKSAQLVFQARLLPGRTQPARAAGDGTGARCWSSRTVAVRGEALVADAFAPGRRRRSRRVTLGHRRASATPATRRWRRSLPPRLPSPRSAWRTSATTAR